MPSCVYIETTNVCNAHCIMCPHDKMQRPRGHMDESLFKQIIDQCREFEGAGLQVFLHKDGEPLLDPFLADRIRYAKQTLLRSNVHFNTNAMLLTEERIAAILDSRLDSLVFSVDGASAETYEQIRCGLSYDTVCDNIRRFFEARKARGSGPRVLMQMVVSKINQHENEKYRDLWGGKADRLVFKPMHNFLVQGTALKGGEIGQRQLKRCGMPFHTLLIYHNGDLGLCCWDYDHIRDLGRVQDAPLLDLFNRPAYNEVRAAMKKMDCSDIAPCSRCSQIYGHDGPMWS